MPKWLRALIAGYGAKKLGGGCLSTILIFIVIYYALGQCNRPAATRPADINKPAVTTGFVQKVAANDMPRHTLHQFIYFKGQHKNEAQY